MTSNLWSLCRTRPMCSLATSRFSTSDTASRYQQHGFSLIGHSQIRFQTLKYIQLSLTVLLLTINFID